VSIFKSDPAAPGANVGRRRGPVHDSPLDCLEEAVARFNASEEARTVAGLMRTLGEPMVSIGAAAGSRGEVRITVAWDLCWYQWGVALGDAGRAVSSIASGAEIEDLDRSARQWNAGAVEGRVVLGGAPSAPRRRFWLRRR